MNPFDDRLRRLLKAASQAPRPRAGSLPFGLDSRVLAEARAMAVDMGESGLVFLRRALLCCSAVMVLSFVFYYRTLATPTSAEVDIANSVIEQNMP